MLAGSATGCAGAGESTSQEVWVNASSKEGTATDGTSKEGASQEGSSKEASNEATSAGTQNANRLKTPHKVSGRRVISGEIIIRDSVADR